MRRKIRRAHEEVKDGLEIIHRERCKPFKLLRAVLRSRCRSFGMDA